MIGVCFFLYVVFFLIVESIKFRFGYDECFFNLWIRDFFFKLDYFLDLFRYVFLGYF